MSSASPEAAAAGSNSQVRRLVVTLHGIRTFGGWQERLADLLKGKEGNYEVLTYRFGWFSVFRFLFPFSRWLVTRRFRQWLIERYEHRPDLERVDFVAHSFGTWMVAYALLALRNMETLPSGRPIPPTGTVILAGSVLRESFPWNDLVDSEAVGRVANECAWRDFPLVLSQLFGIGTGIAGRFGFDGGEGPRFRNRFYDFGHSGWFYDKKGNRSHEKMDQLWVPMLLGNPREPIDEIDDRPERLPWWQEAWHMFLRNAVPVKIVMYTLLIVAPLFGFWQYREQWKYEQQLAYERAKRAEERAMHEAKQALLVQQLRKMTLVVEATKLLPRNPVWVQQFLHAANGPEESDFVAKLLPHLRFTDPEQQDHARIHARLYRAHQELQSADDPIGWHIRGLVFSWLARNTFSEGADKPSLPAGMSPAKRLQGVRHAFDTALAQYGTSQAAPLLVALCHLDYARCLLDWRERGDAEEQLRLALKQVPQRSNLSAAWFLVEVHTQQAAAKRADRFREAIADLHLALKAARPASTGQPDPDCQYLLGSTYNRLGWFHLHKMELDEAKGAFIKGRDILQGIKGEDTQAEAEWLHARHGLAMVRRLLGHADEARKEFHAIHEEIAETLEKAPFTWRQRRAMIVRLVNACEREADCMLVTWDYDRIRAPEAVAAYEELEKHARRYNLDQDLQGLLTLAVNQCKLGLAHALAQPRQESEARAKVAEVENVRGKFDLPADRDRLDLFLLLSRDLVEVLTSQGDVRAQALERLQRDYLAESERKRDFARDEVEFLILVETLLLRLQTDEAARKKIESAGNAFREKHFPEQLRRPAPPPFLQKR